MSKQKLITTGEMLLTSFLMAFISIIFYGMTLIDGQLLILLLAFMAIAFLMLLYLFILVGFLLNLGRYLGIVKTERFNNWY
jgi:hypothetical protein